MSEDGIILCQNEDGIWDEKKEPYAIVECPTEEDFNRLKKLMKFNWIPVSERYPDSDRYILLSFENFTIPSVGHYEEKDDGGIFYLGDDELCLQNGLFVNAWMELPESYKENA